MKTLEQTSFGARLKQYRTGRNMTQNELAVLLGVSQETITNYERNGRFPRSQTLQAIARLFGVSLDTLLGHLPPAKDPSSQEHLINAAIGLTGFGSDELISILRNEALENAYAYTSAWKAAGSYAIADFYQLVLIPILTRIGLLWQQGELSVADEHRLSEKIRELSLLHANQEYAANPLPSDSNRRWMGLCAPGEKHEMALLLHSLVLRRSGWNTWYLGIQVPISDLLGSISRFKPQVLAISVTMPENLEGLELYVNQIRTHFGPRPAIIVGGTGAAQPGPGLRTAVDAFASSIIDGFELTERLADDNWSKALST